MGYDADARGAGKYVREILERRPWTKSLQGDAELDFIEWVATWAFHWANKHQETAHARPQV